LSLDLGGYDLDAEVAANTLAAADMLREAGGVVEQVDVGWTKEQALDTAFVHFGTMFGPYVGADLRKRSPQ
jgi:aspartyl-tRNA(Asn)/glutamyl-tRNA(Gln) amidotransferase subunit A